MRPIKTIHDELVKETAEAKAFHTKHFKADENAYDFVKGSPEHTEWAQRHEKLASLKDEHAEAVKAADFAKMADMDFGGRGDSLPLEGRGEVKSLGHVYTGDCEIKARLQTETFQSGNIQHTLKGVDMLSLIAGSLKAPYTHTSDATDAGFPAPTRRTDIVVPIPRNKLFLQDMAMSMPWDQGSVEWMKQTVAEDNSNVAEETTTKGQNTYKWEPVTVNLKTVAAWAKVTKQQLRRPENIRSILDGELTKDVRKRVQKKCLTGAGTTSNTSDICGIVNDLDIQTLSGSGYESVFDLIFTAMSMVEGEEEGVGGGDPDIVMLSQKDYRRLKLTKDNIGNYMYGSPADPIQDRVWGIYLLGTKDLPESNGLVGDTSTLRHFIGDALNITTGWVQNDFIQNQLVILAEIEMAQIVTKGDSWVRLTNIPNLP